MTTRSLDPSVADRGVGAPRDGRGSPASAVVRVVIVVLIGAFGVLMLGSVVGPKVLPYKTYFVRSGSMRPTIPVGALAFYRPVDAGALGPGDVIAFSRPGGAGEIVSHRITGVEVGPAGRVFVTKGDANTAPDDWRVPATGRGWRYRWHVPLVGFAVGALGTVEGRLVILLVVGVSLIALALAGIWRTPPAEDHGRLLPVIEARAQLQTVRVPSGLHPVEDFLAPSVAYRRPLQALEPAPAPAPVPAPGATPAWPPPRVVHPALPPAPEAMPPLRLLGAAADPSSGDRPLAGAVAVPHGWEVNDYLTIICCHARLLLRSTPEDDPRRAGLLAITEAAQQAAAGGLPQAVDRAIQRVEDGRRGGRAG